LLTERKYNIKNVKKDYICSEIMVDSAGPLSPGVLEWEAGESPELCPQLWFAVYVRQESDTSHDQV